MGFQSIENRLAGHFAELDFDHYPWITGHSLQISLKRSLDIIKTDTKLQNVEQGDFMATKTTVWQPLER